MGLSLATTIFLFFVCLCGGIAIGMIFGRFKNQRSENPPEEVEKEAGKEDVLPVQGSLSGEEETGILRASIKKGGHAWLEMDGQRLKDRHSLQDEQKKRLTKLVLEMHSWLDDAVTPDTAPTAFPRKQVPGSSRKPIFGKPKVAAPTTASTNIQPHPVSIVDQIEAILQSNLPGTGFEGRNIHLLEGQGGEVLVQIGQERFVGVNAVTDAAIKEFIRKAVADWERGQK